MCNVSACNVQMRPRYAFDVFRAHQKLDEVLLPFLSSFPLFHKLVSVKNFVQSSYRSFLPISPPQFFRRRKSFLPIKYSLRIAYVSRARISRKICQDSLAVELLPFIPRQGKNYNKRFPSRDNLFAYTGKFEFR